MTTTSTAAKKAASKYTPAMVARMNELAPLNQALAEQLAAEFGEGFSARSIAAKASRENIPYIKKVPTAKNGAPVEKKEAIVAEIVGMVGLGLDGLEKASKVALQRLRDHLIAVGE